MPDQLPDRGSMTRMRWASSMVLGRVASNISRLLHVRRERSSVDWDELAEDEIVNPWVKAQLRQAAAAARAE